MDSKARTAVAAADHAQGISPRDAAYQELNQRRTEVIQWAEHRTLVLQHIRNGATRGLYPRVVADSVIRHMSMYEELLVDQLTDAAMEFGNVRNQ